QVARILDVPIVTFGHTHDEALWRIDRPSGARSWYFNTGTWIAVFTHDVLVPRERVQFTFLRVRGATGELLHWSPGRGAPMPVVPRLPPYVAPAVTPRRRVLLVVVDGLRADVAETLPALGRLSRAGARAELWADPPTLSSAQYVALLTGVAPRDSGRRSNQAL